MFAQSFPPVDHLITTLSKIEYKKHFNNYMDIVETIVLYVSAVSYVLFQKVSEWYQNGGKDSTIQLIQKIRNFLAVCYTWIRSEGYPKLKNLMNKIIQTYQDWKGLVTV
jgi:hypothetical protein